MLAAGTASELRNSTTTPTVVLELLAASGASTDEVAGVTHAVLVQREVTLPNPPVVLTLARVTVEPGARMAIPPYPVETVFATVGRSQAFLLSGEGFNRGPRPMDVYLLAIGPG